MKDFSILIGGQAGSGIESSSFIIASLLNHLGYHVYNYRDYPSVITGGYTFSIIRVATTKILTHKNEIDFVLALNQNTVDFHKHLLKKEVTILYDPSSVNATGLAIDVKSIIKEEKAKSVMANTCIIAALAKVLNIEWTLVAEVFKKHFRKETELNLKVAKRSYDSTKTMSKIKPISKEKRPLLTGNDAVSLGLIKGGLETYIGYPMTPTSGVLHLLAKVEDEFNLKVIHPESELSVIIMALGFAYTGSKVAVGTSGGGFCLMTEGVSFAAIAELPVVIVLGQRPGPGTGLPTYTGQTELDFVLSAGHGEFVRFIVAPGDLEEACFFSAVALNIAWKFQIPAFVVVDKTLAEGVYTFDTNIIKEIEEEKIALSDKKKDYKRYQFTENGVSPLAFVPQKDAVIKVNSYEHDESGVTTESIYLSKAMQEKRLKKEKYLLKEIEKYEIVSVYGNKDSSIALVCFGSNKGVCLEVANLLNIKLVFPKVLSPFPKKQFEEASKDIKTFICVENNATGQLANLLSFHKYKIDEKILKYDGRPFALDELEKLVKKVIK
ncbi:MAG: 2-oxoglutarate oxidoreductase subunit KorA [Candidatus Anoxychlamydiales bacterium]|nr:2-oxoglutarate oxidoreductase subunit KorA [Candidatus Anoxychlamydiales bacterium]NGX35474.1 2-oxoglutarate oxidoreductase subunit KorA [Candidatus Anoxychlamydiales bacterium]